MQLPLWEHQKKAIERAVRSLGRFALFFDPGCGKTRTALEIFNFSKERKIIILAPLNVCRNWQNEIAAFSNQVQEVYVAAGQVKAKKIKLIREFQACKSSAALILNLESLRSKEYRDLLEEFRTNFLVIDESHNFKSPTSLQTKGLIALTQTWKPKHLYLLTGTPAPQGEIDLWSTFFLLKKTDKPFFVWRKIYFDDKNARRAGTVGYYPDFVVRASSKIEFQKLLSECSITANKNEVLDLPPLLRTKVFCELSPEQRRYYDTMFEFLFAIDSQGNELEASNILSRTLRLQQIVAGFLGEVSIKQNPRIDALKYAIDKTAGAQFIIWTIFKATYKQIGETLEELGISYRFLTGEQSAEERYENMMSFQSGEVRVLIGHPRAGGVGVNLTAASYSIHYTKNYNLVDDLQCEARNYRGGSERHERITRIDIIAEKTIDEDISEALAGKADVQNFIMGLKKKYGRESGSGIAA
jgi:SNF2 family DNA or RNA helicase